MGKRFTATEKWDDPWFYELDDKGKLVWLWLLDKCNHAGIWDVNKKLLISYLGVDPDLAWFKGRVIELKSGKWFIPRFIEFQYGTLNPDIRAHKSVISILEREGVNKPLTNSLQGVKDKDKDKDMDKDQDKERGSGGKQSTGVSKPVDNSKKEPTPFWKEMTDHIHKTWEAKKKAKLYLKPQQYKELKSLAGVYMPWGVMALWDDFLASGNDWVRSTGYSFSAFVSHIPTLVDNYKWKAGSQKYEAALNHPVSALPAGSPPDVVKLAIDSIKTRP